jgi:hypothetical protein
MGFGFRIDIPRKQNPPLKNGKTGATHTASGSMI